ncbi:MAG TPA: hypothetical protein VIJ85_03120 [Rhizomicrobium sp.]
MEDKANGVTRILARAWNAPIRNTGVEIIAVIGFVPLLLGVALWNGFPLIFYDTGAYVLQGLGRIFQPERSPVYSLFLSYGGGGVSLWFIAIIQAFATSYVIVQLARVEAPKLRLGWFIAIAAALTLFTALPWYAGQIEPDCFTALTVLCTYLLALHTGGMGRGRSIAIFAIGSFAAATHPSHLLLIAGLVMVVGVLKIVTIVSHGREALQKSNIALPLLSAGLGLCLIVAGNYVLTGKYFLNRAGSVFVFASFLQDGIVQHLLDDTCPGSHYALCAYRKHLPGDAEQYLWLPYSPFNKLGRFTGTAVESQRMVDDMLVRYPGLVAMGTLRDTAEQLFSFRTGDQIEPQEWAIYKGLNRYIPDQMRSYVYARQQQGKIHFPIVNAVDVPVAALAQLAMLVGLFVTLRRRRWGAAVFLGFMAAALFGNALICGALSNPHDRYQSRLMWLPVLALSLLWAEGRFSLRRPAESGT